MSFGLTSTVGVPTLVMSAASAAAATFPVSVEEALFAARAMSRTAVVFACLRFGTTSSTFHAGTRPFGDSRGFDVVVHSRLRTTMNPVRAVKATRKPSRAPRLVPSSR